MSNPMPQIKHFVYLMFENRSYDNLLGWLYDQENPPANIIAGPKTKGEPFMGLAGGDHFNCFEGDPTKHPVVKGTRKMNTPDPDPHEPYLHVNVQLFNGEEPPTTPPKGYVPPLPPNGTVPEMSGFLRDYYHDNYNSPAAPLVDIPKYAKYAKAFLDMTHAAISKEDALQILETYSPEQVPIINGLARSYATSDHWFCSVPTQTNANRAFSVLGTSTGLTDNFNFDHDMVPNRFEAPSIWEVLSNHGKSGPEDWMVYYSDKTMFKYCYAEQAFRIPDPDTHVAPIEKFFEAAEKGTLPTFSYLEPAWFRADLAWGNGSSYHPPADIIPGEILLKMVYEALSSNPEQWKDTLFMVTFDEHGGTYDHVPPPWGAVPPWGEGNEPPEGVELQWGFGFDRFGVRVPTIMASPWIDEGTVFRSLTDVPYDHTSMIATVLEWHGIPRDQWNLGERVANAPTFESVLNRSTPRSDVPKLELSDEEQAYAKKDHIITDLPVSPMQMKMLPMVVKSLNDETMTEDAADTAIAKILEGADSAGKLFENLEAYAKKVASKL